MELFNNINLGITTECNAKCYLCNRSCIPDFPKNINMNISILDKILPHTKSIQIIGGFGDFINHPQSLEFAEKMQDVDFNIETNGELHDEYYWKQLALLAKDENHSVQFSIDDIENEVNPYRKVNTEKVLHNLSVFRDAGGHAKIKTILFQFNESQIEKMKIKFGENFYTQQSMFYPKYGLLSAPSFIKHDGSISLINKINKMKMRSPLTCPWQDGRWLLVNELGEVHICCYILTFLAGKKDRAPKSISEYTKLEYYGELYDLYLKNKDNIDLNNVSLEAAYSNEYNQYVIKNFKNINRCKISCGTKEGLKKLCQSTHQI